MKMYWLLALLSLVIPPWAMPAFADQPGHGGSDEKINCPEDLSNFREEMESLLRLIDVPEFIRTMRESLTASIPDAIRQADGLQAQIVALKEEIQYQEHVKERAEFIAREASNNPSGPLTPCRRREKGGFCSAVERYYMAKAANLANRGFLNALQCYQEAGLR